MTRPASTRPLRLVRPPGQAVDELLAALEYWSATGQGPPAAYLEAGDEEIRGEFPLTHDQVTALTALLRNHNTR